MKVICYTDPSAYQKAAGPILLAHEARYCVAIGVSADLVRDPGKWKKFHLGCVDQDGQVIAALLMTPPHPLFLTDLPAGAFGPVLDHIATFADRPSGMVGESQMAERFQEEWCQRSGAKVVHLMRQGIFQLDQVKLSPKVPGEMIVASTEHFDLLLESNRNFIRDCQMNAEHHLATERRAVELAIQNRNRFLWVLDGEPVSMANAAGKTPHGIRVNWVYTPQPLRGNGYATKLVSQLSQSLLDAGNRFCFLFTDLANPTSNSIYQKIGYRRIGDSSHYEFAY
jgi:hypothetical protein